MNTNDPRYELIRRCRDEDASQEEHSQLEALLRNDRSFREAYVRYANLDVALSTAPKSREMPPGAHAESAPSRKGWLSWRPLTAAAAGMVLGLFCAGAAWAVVRPQQAGPQVNVALLEESFESPQAHWPQGFPTQAGNWGGERVRVVGTQSEIVPLDGGVMAELAPAEGTTLSYLDRIIDIRGYPQPEAHERRQIEVTASFHAAAPGFKERYTLRVATFGEGPAEIQSKWVNVPWREMDGGTLTLSKRGLSTLADSSGWQTLSVVVEAPADATSVVISLAAGRLESSAPKAPHYLDHVQARLLVSPRTTHLRRRLR